MERSEIQAFARTNRTANAGFLERKLWDVAETAPLGGTLIGSALNPYLLRIYVSPRDPQFAWLWGKLKALRVLEDELGEFESDLFRGIPHLYLHHFFRGDADSELHNHPWLFSMSLILTGGYIEERWHPETRTLRTRHCHPGDVNVIRSTDFHRVTLMRPDRGCWTLFLSSNRVEEKNGHDWGFLDTKTDRYTPWGEFVQRRQAANG